MKKFLLLFLAIGFVFTACDKKDDPDPDPVVTDDPMNEPMDDPMEDPMEDPASVADYPVQDFMWQTMNLYYFYQESVANLADNKFPSLEDQSYADFLASKENPFDFYDVLLSSEDRFSFLSDDYKELTSSFQGVSKSDGVDFGLLTYGSTGRDVLGYVRYIEAGSDADGKEIKRGDIFIGVNGTNLNLDNYVELLFGDLDTYTLNFAAIIDNTVTPTGRELTLTKQENFAGNPIQVNTVIEVDDKKIGYLMYNQFSGTSGEALNDAFGELKNAGITDMVLDLRYNPGGFGYITQILGSLIYGPNTEEVFFKRRFNSKLEEAFGVDEGTKFVATTGTSGGNNDTPLNSLNLNKIHVIATGSSASASELLMNGLAPYVEVVHVGSRTVGKNQGSLTFVDDPENGNVYDSEREGQINPDNQWAIQPIISQTENSEGFGEYQNGLIPDIEIIEDITDLGTLGFPNERLLGRAIQDIRGITGKTDFTPVYPVELLTSSSLEGPMGGKLIFNDLPEKMKLKSKESNEQQ
jgi:C-terminal processing protease CtpA/Prc